MNVCVADAVWWAMDFSPKWDPPWRIRWLARRPWTWEGRLWNSWRIRWRNSSRARHGTPTRPSRCRTFTPAWITKNCAVPRWVVITWFLTFIFWRFQDDYQNLNHVNIMSITFKAIEMQKNLILNFNSIRIDISNLISKFKALYYEYGVNTVWMWYKHVELTLARTFPAWSVWPFDDGFTSHWINSTEIIDAIQQRKNIASTLVFFHFVRRVTRRWWAMTGRRRLASTLTPLSYHACHKSRDKMILWWEV